MIRPQILTILTPEAARMSLAASRNLWLRLSPLVSNAILSSISVSGILRLHDHRQCLSRGSSSRSLCSLSSTPVLPWGVKDRRHFVRSRIFSHSVAEIFFVVVTLRSKHADLALLRLQLISSLLAVPLTNFAAE
jgi:hypothetical protein